MSEHLHISHPVGEHKQKGPQLHREVIHYGDGHLLIRFTGDPSAELDLSKHKYDPGTFDGQGLVVTHSGNRYLIRTDQDSTVVINAGESARSRRLVGGHSIEYPARFNPIRFGEPWEVVGVGTTSPVEEVYLGGKWAHPSQDAGYPKVEGQNPIGALKQELVPLGFRDRHLDLSGVLPLARFV